MAFTNTTATQKASTCKPEWYLLDATDIPLGRLSTRIATILRGKHKPTYSPGIDNGDHVIVINAEKVKLTGHKATNSVFYRHTGFIGGIRAITPAAEKHPERVVERAVKRMLPKESSQARGQFKKLHVYTGAEHPHAAQQPKAIEAASASKAVVVSK
ncbi:MAG TPA: 50S ribosomal protein L13 [Alphaproteobacteria bacterium]|nr:50S ribosomal protein L13 [Alphaproteobacteria bacterium]